MKHEDFHMIETELDKTTAWKASDWHSIPSIANNGLPWAEVEREHLLLSDDIIRGKYQMNIFWRVERSIRTAFHDNATPAVTNHCTGLLVPGHSLDCRLHTGRFHDNGLWMVYWISYLFSGEWCKTENVTSKSKLRLFEMIVSKLVFFMPTLSVQLCIPDWPMYNRDQVTWLEEIGQSNRSSATPVAAVDSKPKHGKKNWTRCGIFRYWFLISNVWSANPLPHTCQYNRMETWTTSRVAPQPCTSLTTQLYLLFDAKLWHSVTKRQLCAFFKLTYNQT